MGQTPRENISVVLRHGRTRSKMCGTVLRFGKQKKTEQLFKVSHPCLDDHQIKKEDLEIKGELFEVCSHIVLKCFFLARIGRPDILWSVNKLARPVTKWTQACDRTTGTINFLTFMSRVITANIVMWAMRLNIVDWGYCKIQTLQGDLEDSDSTSGLVLCIFGSRTFCTDQLDAQGANVSVSQLHRIRYHIVPALDLWDLVIEVLGMTQRIPKPTQTCTRETGVKTEIKPKIEQVLDQNVDLSNIDHVSSEQTSL